MLDINNQNLFVVLIDKVVFVVLLDTLRLRIFGILFVVLLDKMCKALSKSVLLFLIAPILVELRPTKKVGQNV